MNLPALLPTRRRVSATLLAGLVAYGLGFVWFLRKAEEIPTVPQHADAIVVLTGGPDRVETGLRLLVAGHAARLLISGLGGGATVPDLARRAGLDPAALLGRVTLGRRATTTRTNATETAPFVRANAVRDLIVVTSGYHMPRALLELRQVMPGVTLHPAPVATGQGGGRSGSWRLLLEEYSKWLVVVARISGGALFQSVRELLGPDTLEPDSPGALPRVAPAPGQTGALAPVIRSAIPCREGAAA